jgi:hypothetical protein
VDYIIIPMRRKRFLAHFAPEAAVISPNQQPSNSAPVNRRLFLIRKTGRDSWLTILENQRETNAIVGRPVG